MIRLDNYKRIHNRRMRDFVEEGFVTSDTVTFDQPKDGYIAVHGQIRCLGGLQIDVDKRLRIVSGDGGGTRVKKADYSYNVSVSGRENVFRYDGPDDHHRHHHVHRFDRDGHQTSEDDIYDENDVPTLGEVIAEARDLYYSPEFNEEPDDGS